MKTSTLRPILCGTDFSENARKACAVAGLLARRLDRTAVLLHVADEFSARSGAPGELDEFLRPIQEQLNEETERLKATGATVTGQLLHGQLAERAILTFAASHPPDLMVVSAVSKTPFDRWTLGSVSERIAESAAAPTLVVRSADPFESWIRGDRPLRLFVAAEFSESAYAALRWVADFRKLGPCDVTVAYVNWPPEESARLGGHGPTRFTQNQPDVQHRLERDLRERVTLILGDDSAVVRVCPNWGRIDAHLVELARESNADLLVVGSHQRHGIDLWHRGSVSRGVLRHAPMSVVIVPLAGAPSPLVSVRPCRRVLVATDLGQHGGLAVPYACSIVNNGGCVRIVHVVEPFKLPNPLLGGMPNALPGKRELDQQIARASELLGTMVPAGMQSRDVLTEVKILQHEDASEAICVEAEAFNADIVCVGAHTRPGATARVMGSISLNVLQHCRRPVLVVWPPID